MDPGGNQTDIPPPGLRRGGALQEIYIQIIEVLGSPALTDRRRLSKVISGVFLCYRPVARRTTTFKKTYAHSDSQFGVNSGQEPPVRVVQIGWCSLA